MTIESRQSRQRRLRVKRKQYITLIKKIIRHKKILSRLIKECDKIRLELDTDSTVALDTFNEKFARAFDMFNKIEEGIVLLTAEAERLNGLPIVPGIDLSVLTEPF